MTEQAMRERIVAEATSWLGTPYHHMGRVKGAGVDCLQILIAVYSAVGLMPAIEPGYYPGDWMLHRDEERYLSGALQHAQPLPEGAAPQPGDVVLYRFGRCFSHSAIVLDAQRYLHAYIHQGVVLADPAQPPLAGRPSRCFTFFPGD